MPGKIRVFCLHVRGRDGRACGGLPDRLACPPPHNPNGVASRRRNMPGVTCQAKSAFFACACVAGMGERASDCRTAWCVANPDGVPSHSPGLRRTRRYPGIPWPPNNPNGVASRSGRRRRGRCAPGAMPPGGGMPPALPADTTPSGLDRMRAWMPGVAPRASGQPRAARRNRVAVGYPAVVVWGETWAQLRNALAPLPTAGPCCTKATRCCCLCSEGLWDACGSKSRGPHVATAACGWPAAAPGPAAARPQARARSCRCRNRRWLPRAHRPGRRRRRPRSRWRR